MQIAGLAGALHEDLHWGHPCTPIPCCCGPAPWPLAPSPAAAHGHLPNSLQEPPGPARREGGKGGLLSARGSCGPSACSLQSGDARPPPNSSPKARASGTPCIQSGKGKGSRHLLLHCPLQVPQLSTGSWSERSRGRNGKPTSPWVRQPPAAPQQTQCTDLL